MHKTDTDKKLELVRIIRMQNQHNRQTLRQREGILHDDYFGQSRGEIYGLEEAVLPMQDSKIADSSYVNPGFFGKDTGESVFRGFRIRLVLVMLLFLGFVYMDIKEIAFSGITTDKIFSLLQEEQLIKLIQLSKDF